MASALRATTSYVQSWKARRLTKPSVWYGLFAVVIILQFLLAVLAANVPAFETYSWVAWLAGGGSLMTGLVYLSWRSMHAAAVQVTLQDRWLVIDEGGRQTRFDVTRATIRHGRWAYSGMGGMGTIIEVQAPEGRLRLGVPVMLAAERYVLPDSHSLDLQIDPPAADHVIAALDRCSGAFGRPGYRAPQDQATFAIPLVANRARGTVRFVVMSFALPVVLTLIVVPLSNGVTVASVVATFAGLVLAGGLVTFYLRQRREGRRYQLRIVGDEVLLEDLVRGELVTRATPPNLVVTPTYHVLTMRSGTWNLPSLRLELPGFDGELTITGTGVDPQTWVPRATKAKAAKYVIGLAEWNLLLRAIGWR